MNRLVRRSLTVFALSTFGFGVYACTGDANSADEPNQSSEAAESTSPALARRAVSKSVLEHHGNASRDGFFVDPTFTDAAIRTLHRDTTFAGVVTGKVYAQPLFVERGPGNRET